VAGWQCRTQGSKGHEWNNLKRAGGLGTQKLGESILNLKKKTKKEAQTPGLTIAHQRREKGDLKEGKAPRRWKGPLTKLPGWNRRKGGTLDLSG